MFYLEGEGEGDEKKREKVKTKQEAQQNSSWDISSKGGPLPAHAQYVGT